ncbi:response regulator transcription factor [Leucobacter sp. USHLN153]|uniref:response regulator transcription factor n=1 Tax=Leucobacter sp. USHLN153 TaxID=3081268 RepID=UPI0030174BB1
MSNETIRVMLVDDQELIRTGFRLVLLAEPGVEVVAEASDGAEALQAMESLEPDGCDIVLMDVRMPGMNGIDATRAVVERFPRVRVIVLTTFDLDEYATGAIRAGASGFLLKDARPTELVDAIRRVAAGDATMAPSVTRRLLEQLRGGNATLLDPEESSAGGLDDAFGALTERELDVLRRIAEGKNNAEISAELFLSESTVKTHVGRVLAKLQLRDRVHAVIFAKQHGL